MSVEYRQSAEHIGEPGEDYIPAYGPELSTEPAEDIIETPMLLDNMLAAANNRWAIEYDREPCSDESYEARDLVSEIKNRIYESYESGQIRVIIKKSDAYTKLAKEILEVTKAAKESEEQK